MLRHELVLNYSSDRFLFSSRRRHTRCLSDWSSDVCSSDLVLGQAEVRPSLLAAVAAGAGAESLRDDDVVLEEVGHPGPDCGYAACPLMPWDDGVADRKSVV